MRQKPTKATSLDEQILSLIADGGSQKGVARELGVSEWRVRCVVRAQTTRLIVRRETKDVRLHKVERKQVKATRALILSDVHIPYHDHGALAVAMEFAKDYRPDVIVLNGDILDGHNVSSHPREKHGVITFEDELAECRQFLRVLRHQHPKAVIYYTMGNHEDRLQRFLTNQAADLSSLPELSLDVLLDMAALSIQFVDARQKVKVGPVEVFHGTIIRKDGGNSARATMMKRGGSVLMGHTHRLAVVRHTNKHGVAVAVENGHLSDADPTWTQDPDWQHGFTTIEAACDQAQVRQHLIVGGVLVVDGLRYAAVRA